MKTRICICGGGSQGHVIGGYLASKKQYEVNILTTKPELWDKTIAIEDNFKKSIQGEIQKISSKPEDVIPGCRYVLLCLPGYAIKETLSKISSWLDKDTFIGSIVSSTGFFFIAHDVLNSGTPLFGFQRTPFIARTHIYGKSAHLLGYKSELQIATLNIKDPSSLVKEIETMFDTPTRNLEHFLEVSLTNSNPLLHPARLYSLFKDWNTEKTIDYIPGFYSEWTNEASQILIECDKEFHSIISQLPINPKSIPCILDYYESIDATTLTKKMHSIKAFKEIKVAMKQTKNGYVPAYDNRYFTEDFPFGLLIIKSIGEALKVKTPYIDTVLKWGQSKLNKIYLGQDGFLVKENLGNTGYICPQTLKKIIATQY